MSKSPTKSKSGVSSSKSTDSASKSSRSPKSPKSSPPVLLLSALPSFTNILLNLFALRNNGLYSY